LFDRSISVIAKYMQRIGAYRLKVTDRILFVDIEHVTLTEIDNLSIDEQINRLNQIYFRRTGVVGLIKLMEMIFKEVSICLGKKSTTNENLHLVDDCSVQFDMIMRTVKRLLLPVPLNPTFLLRADNKITSILVQKDMNVDEILRIDQCQSIV
jgi:hypothetical protein